ncbi:MAG: hypothetical protein SCH98_03100 [Deferrisomatales bacterium]|nr:hypothetical protein [Deferrisomatales bacterium]
MGIQRLGGRAGEGDEPVGGDKVIRVDFRRGRGRAPGGFGGGPRLLLGVFLGVLTVELLLVSALFPETIASFFFGPTVIAVAVIATLWTRRVIARAQVSRLHRRTVRRARDVDGPDDHRGHTLH